MSVQRLVGYAVSAVLFCLGILFAWAASAHNGMRLVVGIVMLGAGFGILLLVRRQQPREIVQRLEVPGKIVAQEVRCPNCSASVDMNQIKVIEGTTVAKCSYCGHTFELVEEPKW